LPHGKVSTDGLELNKFCSCRPRIQHSLDPHPSEPSSSWACRAGNEPQAFYQTMYFVGVFCECLSRL